MTERLRVQTIELPPVDSLLDLLPATDAYAWVRAGEGLVAWGEVVRHKAGSMAEAQAWWADFTTQLDITTDLTDPPWGTGCVAFGSFVFDPDNTAAQSQLIVPQVVVGRRGGRAWLTTVGPVVSDPPGRLRSARVDRRPARVPALLAGHEQGLDHPQPPTGVQMRPGALTPGQWSAAVAEGVRRIATGGLDKVVLARDLLVSADSDLDARYLAGRLAAEYTRCWTYLVDGLVGATPEMLVRLQAGLATSRVLAGTIRRTGDDRRDLNLAAALAVSSKDLEEHEYAVSSVAAALAPSCSGMNVPDAPYVLALPNVLHLATDVTAVAGPGVTSLGLAAALHPSAAVCGTPTDAARALIAELEHLDRERYSGAVGWIDTTGDGEWGIALRCGQVNRTDPREIRLYAGCGIVAGSEPADEVAESDAKFLPMLQALGL